MGCKGSETSVATRAKYELTNKQRNSEREQVAKTSIFQGKVFDSVGAPLEIIFPFS